MKLTERFERLCEAFSITAHDWREYYNEIDNEKLPPVKSYSLIRKDFEPPAWAE